MKKYSDYDDVPWLRKSGVSSFFALVGLLAGNALPFSAAFAEEGNWGAFGFYIATIFPLSLLILIPCFALVTGDVYLNKKGKDGFLKPWGVANKVFAMIIIVYTGWQILIFGGAFMAILSAL